MSVKPDRVHIIFNNTYEQVLGKYNTRISKTVVKVKSLYKNRISLKFVGSYYIQTS